MWKVQTLPPSVMPPFCDGGDLQREVGHRLVVGVVPGEEVVADAEALPRDGVVRRERVHVVDVALQADAVDDRACSRRTATARRRQARAPARPPARRARAGRRPGTGSGRDGVGACILQKVVPPGRAATGSLSMGLYDFGARGCTTRRTTRRPDGGPGSGRVGGMREMGWAAAGRARLPGGPSPVKLRWAPAGPRARGSGPGGPPGWPRSRGAARRPVPRRGSRRRCSRRRSRRRRQ